MKLTNNIQLEFLDGTFETTISVERLSSIDKTKAKYLINAVTSTGYDLTNSSHGLINFRADANNRLKSSKSIKAEAEILLAEVESFLRAEAKHTINSRLVLNHELSNGQYQWLRAKPDSRSIPFPAHCIKSKQSGQVISWYEHDVYSSGVSIEIELVRAKDGQLQAFADEIVLYDKSKLQALADSERFIQKRFAFFFYDEVNRLLDRPIVNRVNAMSGLFSSGGAK